MNGIKPFIDFWPMRRWNVAGHLSEQDTLNFLREKLAQEQMRVFKEKGINPFGSCLPTLIQFPIIIGLYQSIIRTMATSPLGLLELARSIYPSLSAAALIPLKTQREKIRS